MKFLKENWIGIFTIALFALFAFNMPEEDVSDKKITRPYRFDRDTAVNSDTDYFYLGGSSAPYVIEDGNYQYSVQVKNDELSGTATTVYYVQASNAAAGDYWTNIDTSASYTDDGNEIMSGQFYGARIRVMRTNSGTSTCASDIAIKMTPTN